MVSLPPTSPHNNHLGSVAAKAAALPEETMSSWDTAAYTWHSGITTFRCGVLTWPFQPRHGSAAKRGHPLWYLTPFHLGTASPLWNSVAGAVFNDGIHARLRLSTQNRTEFPRALVNVMFENAWRLLLLYEATVRIRCCGLWVQWRSGWEGYFCQPVISDQSNYTLINQVWSPDGCGPIQLKLLASA